MPELKVAHSEDSKTTLSPKGRFFDYTLLIIVLLLIVYGLIMVYSTSAFSGMQEGDPAKYFRKQLISTMIGFGFMLLATFIDYRRWYKLKVPIYILSVLSIFLVIPFGADINGANRWIRIGGFSLQPAEIVKLGLIVSLAGFITYSGKKISKFRNNLFFCGMAGIAALFILVITNNLSTAIIVLGIAYLMIVVGNNKPKWYIVLMVALVAIATVIVVLIFKNPDGANGFRFKRILAWRDPEAYASDVGFQTLQSLYALGSGGFFGKGLGQSLQKLGFIPEAQNDMVFSVICEELGLFGGICLIVLFILLIWRLMIIANNAPDLFGSMIVVGVMAHISIQVVLNIAVVTNAIPNTGVTLPFISYGGSSVVFLMTEIGLVFSVSRQVRVPVTVKSRPERPVKTSRQNA